MWILLAFDFGAAKFRYSHQLAIILGLFEVLFWFPNDVAFGYGDFAIAQRSLADGPLRSSWRNILLLGLQTK
jgi:putative oxidoreductase